MFVFAPDEPPDQLPSQLQAVVEGFVDGILILTEVGEWIHANASARHFCHQLICALSKPSAIPESIWQMCKSLIDDRNRYPEQKTVLETEVTTPTGIMLRIRVQWLQPEISIAPIGCQDSALASNRPYLLVILEDRSQSAQNLAASSARKYGLTQRQKEVWSLWKLGYSYRQIATRLYITPHTVKKHLKDIRAKILEVQAWEE